MDKESAVLNYMYQKGYTEEDMHNPATVRRVSISSEYLKFKILLVLKPLFEAIRTVVKNLWQALKPIAIEINKLNSLPQQKMPTIDYRAKNAMRSQVVSNKPRHQVRKIIK